MPTPPRKIKKTGKPRQVHPGKRQDFRTGTVWLIDGAEYYVEDIPKARFNFKKDTRFPSGGFARGKRAISKTTGKVYFLRIETHKKPKNPPWKAWSEGITKRGTTIHTKLTTIANALGYHNDYTTWVTPNQTKSRLKLYSLQPYYKKTLGQCQNGVVYINNDFLKLELNKRLQLLTALICDVQKLHKAGYIHCDISFDNIACDYDDSGAIKRLVLIDTQDAAIKGSDKKMAHRKKTYGIIKKDYKSCKTVDARFDLLSLAMLVALTCVEWHKNLSHPIAAQNVIETRGVFKDIIDNLQKTNGVIDTTKFANSDVAEVLASLLTDYARPKPDQDYQLSMPKITRCHESPHEGQGSPETKSPTSERTCSNASSMSVRGLAHSEPSGSPDRPSHRLIAATRGFNEQNGEAIQQASQVDPFRQRLLSAINKYIRQHNSNSSWYGALFSRHRHGHAGIAHARALEALLYNANSVKDCVHCLRQFASETLPGKPLFISVGTSSHSLISYLLQALKTDANMVDQINQYCGLKGSSQLRLNSQTDYCTDKTKAIKHAILAALQLDDPMHLPRNLTAG